jgi:hypothetical protein
MRNAKQLKIPFEGEAPALRSPTTLLEFVRPAGYRGLYAFHKYWGKKPAESVSYLIEQLSVPNDLVVDPFLGFGTIAREAALRNRRFLGSDINPIATELTQLLVCPPRYSELDAAIDRMRSALQSDINGSYRMSDGGTATHYLWREDMLESVWRLASRKGGRKEFKPSTFDKKQAERYENYSPSILRPLRLYHNSRINAFEGLCWRHLFTGRALHNIELILQHIRSEAEPLRTPLSLILTSAIGQMSRMVFAITGRGKTTGDAETKIEVGSWVIGFWRPALSFEVNVWNCYENKAHRLLKAIAQGTEPDISCGKPREVVNKRAQVSINNMTALELIREIPDDAVQLVLTDPPHGDRIPYLELSELWNAVIGKTSSFDDEIVVSNARGRDKTKQKYSEQMAEFFKRLEPKLAEGGYVAVFFNARSKEYWDGLNPRGISKFLPFIGAFPMSYSAGSVVQDNRDGGLKHDYVLLYRKASRGSGTRSRHGLRSVPGWMDSFPNE